MKKINFAAIDALNMLFRISVNDVEYAQVCFETNTVTFCESALSDELHERFRLVSAALQREASLVFAEFEMFV